MSIFSGVVSFLKNIPSDVEHWFVKHGPTIQIGLSDLNGASSIAAGVAAATGETAAVTAIGKVQAGIVDAENLVKAESTAQTLNDQAKAFTDLATHLDSVGVTNAGTKAAVAAVTTKINNVANVLSTAAGEAPAAQPAS